MPESVRDNRQAVSFTAPEMAAAALRTSCREIGMEGTSGEIFGTLIHAPRQGNKKPAESGLPSLRATITRSGGSNLAGHRRFHPEVMKPKSFRPSHRLTARVAVLFPSRVAKLEFTRRQSCAHHQVRDRYQMRSLSNWRGKPMIQKQHRRITGMMREECTESARLSCGARSTMAPSPAATD
jgi:hypothetical protein